MVLPAEATAWTNTTTINMPAPPLGTPPPTPAVPYPSNISVSGLTGTVTDVNLTLNGMNCSAIVNDRAYPEDVDIMLVGPTGANAVVYSDVGGQNDAASLVFPAINITLDDQAANPLPADTQLSAGTYRPVDDDNDTGEWGAIVTGLDPFAAPAPAPSGATALSVFNGTNPNGTWSLYVVDDFPGSDNCLIQNGWTLDVLTSATGTTPTLAVNDVTIAEVDAGTQTFTFTITRSGNTAGTSSVTWNTLDSSAVSPADFTAVGPTVVTFAAGQTIKTASVTVKGDTIVEVNEAFLVRLSSPVGATITDATGVGRINNDDSATFAVNDVTVTEGNSGTKPATFTITRSGDVAGPATVKWQTLNAQATAGTDFAGVAPTTVSFGAGETSKTATATVNGDTVVEANETFLIRLSAPTLAIIGDATGVVRITNDDVASLSVNDVTTTEGNSGTRLATFTIARTGAVGGPASVNWSTANGTATAPDDYTAVGWTTVNFAAGETAKTVSVTLRGDTAVEALETFQVRLASPVWATIVDGSGLGRISNDDVANLSVNDATVAEGDVGATPATFTITRSGAIGGASSVRVYTIDGTAKASVPADYVAIAPTTVTFAPGETTKTLSVTVRGDTTVEANETFSLRLDSPTNASIVDGSGLGRINNDD